MGKIRYLLRDEWEFERLVRYLRDHPDLLETAGRQMLISDLL